MSQVKEGRVRGESGNRRRLADLDVGDVDIFGDNESCRAHDGRHDLPVGAGGNLDGRCFLGRIADLFHERDGKGSRGLRRWRYWTLKPSR